MTTMRRVGWLLLALLAGSAALAEVKLPALFSDGMVLQRGAKVPVWGWAAPGEKVTVTLGKQSAVTTAGADGRWTVRLAPVPAGGPFEMTVAGANTLIITDVLVGEVWVCSGQSNMEWGLQSARNGPQEIAAASFPQIRMFTVGKAVALEPRTECAGRWAVCSPQVAGSFSAVGFFFARDLHQALNVPIGMINSSWGGTLAEAWSPRAALAGSDELKGAFLTPLDQAAASYGRAAYAQAPALKAWLAEAEKANAEGGPIPLPPTIPGADPRSAGPNMATGLYNGMIAPLAPYAIAGAIWYQGESNAGRAAQYRTLFPTMIRGWRQAWGQGDFPFLFVQLANYMAVKQDPGESGWAELREAQTMTLELPKTGMAVIIDIGEANSIHPTNKQDVGKRLALAARAIAYGQEVVYSGPLYAGMAVEGDKIRIRFTHVDGGLVAAEDRALKGFAIRGEDKKWVWADAVIDGESVVVHSEMVTTPVAVRYAWADNPICNLYNKAGLPASPFRTDTPAR